MAGATAEHGQDGLAFSGVADAGRPDRSSPVSSHATRPPALLDLVHLSCQTLGNASLEREVLQLFLAQAESTSHALRCSHDADQRRRLFHLIKGSANGVGAFELAALAGQGEADADKPAHVQHVLAAIDRVRFEIDRLTEVV